MSNSIIQVTNLSKNYTISHEGRESYTALRDVMARKAKKIFSFPKSLQITSHTTKEEFWALRDVNFDIEQGDRVGIIGRNGAGKSTLLKILSRITEPSAGTVKIKGRAAALLEVGTGFHPELTGRENIFLNGAILGMSRAEIKKHFDAIVDFAEVEKFLDTPVKRYSSGMYVRLAFAVAAHLEPEILIVDEVLAVGDAQFQKKCLGKMEDVSRNEGRTILFVSHNMAAVKQICNSGIVLQRGNMIFQGSEIAAVNHYQEQGHLNAEFNAGNSNYVTGNKNIKILQFKVNPIQGDMLKISSGFEFSIDFFNNTPDINLDITFELSNSDDIIVFHNGTLVTTQRNSRIGVYTVTGKIDPYIMNSGIYKFKMIFGQDQRYVLYTHEDIVQFEILNETKGNNSSQLPGVVFLKIPFEIDFKEVDQ